MTSFTVGGDNNSPRLVTLCVCVLQVNYVSSWIDASFVYGRSQVWVNCMRAFKGGKLATNARDPRYPALNDWGLPLHNYPDPKRHKSRDLSEMWSKFNFVQSFDSYYYYIITGRHSCSIFRVLHSLPSTIYILFD